MRTLENHQSFAASPFYVRRDALLATLQEEVDACLANGGGVVALVGRTGSGKSVVAHQFVCENTEAVYLDGLADGMRKATPELRGIAVLDEPWQFEGVGEAIRKHVRCNRGVVVTVAFMETELRTLCGEHLRSVVHVLPWNRPQPIANVTGTQHDAGVLPIEEQAISKSTISGVIRFRSPAGDSWTGFGRTPNWLKAQEAAGLSREQFRVDSTPLKRTWTKRKAPRA